MANVLGTVLHGQVDWYNEGDASKFNRLIQSMEKRQYPRVELPLIVALTHAATGTVELTARDISEGGLFVNLTDPKLSKGATVRVQLRTPNLIETHPTPTVDMQVERSDELGLALSFKNRTAEHLWTSVERLRENLQVGKDYFQVYQSVLLQHDGRGALLIQEYGNWKLPGHYLQVGEDHAEALLKMIDASLGLSITDAPAPIATATHVHAALVEAATLSIAYLATASSLKYTLAADGPIKAARWLHRKKDLNDLTLHDESSRPLIAAHLEGSGSHG